MFPPSFVSIPPGWTISLGRSNDRWRAALERLGMARVDLYQLHNALGQDGFDISHVLGAGGISDSLDKLRAQGMFDHVGFTALGDAGQCKELIASGRVASAQVYYNLLNPSAGRLVGADWPT